MQLDVCSVVGAVMGCTWINKSKGFEEMVKSSCVDGKIDSLGQRSGIREVDGAGAPTDVLLPSISPGLATPSSALVSTESSSNLGAARAHIDIDNACVRASGPNPLPDISDVPRPQTARQALWYIVVPFDGLFKLIEDSDVQYGSECLRSPDLVCGIDGFWNRNGRLHKVSIVQG